MPKLLILGWGYGGLAVAQKLDDLAHGRSKWEITMVDQRDYHLIQVRVHEVAANSIPAGRVRVPFTELLEGRAVNFVQTTIEKIDPIAKKVQTTAGTLDYDRLVVGVGGETAFYSVSGLRDYTFPMKDLEDAIGYRKAVINAFKEVSADTAPPQPKDERLTFVIGGGGLTGTELAGEMVDFCRDLAKRFNLPSKSYRIILVEGSDYLMPQLSKGYGEYVKNELRAKGVIVATNTFIERVEEGQVWLKDGRRVRSKVICWAGGIKAPALLSESGFEVLKDGRILTDGFLRCQQFPEVYVLGDAAAVPDSRTGKYVPWTGQYAEREGYYIAEAIWDEERGIRPQPYAPFSLGIAISLGRREALTISGPIKLSGAAGRLAKNVSYDNYEWNIRYKPKILKV